MSVPRKRPKGVLAMGWASFESAARGRSEHAPTSADYPDTVVRRTAFVVTKALGLHRVGAGETLSIIAQEHGATVDAFLAENPQIVDPNIVHVGDLIAIPPTPAP